MSTEGIPQISREAIKEENWEIPTNMYLIDHEQADFVNKLLNAGWGKDDPEEVTWMGVTYREVLINAMAHGNLGLPSTENILAVAIKEQEIRPTDKKIFITMEVTPEKVVVTVRDEGGGFDPEALPDPTKGDALLDTKGRGMLYIKTFFDTYEIKSGKGGTEVKLVKEKKAKN